MNAGFGKNQGQRHSLFLTKAAVDITIDFDLSKSLVLEGAVCKLKPVLHIVDTAGAATIEGTIDNLLFSESYIVITVYDSTDEQ